MKLTAEEKKNVTTLKEGLGSIKSLITDLDKVRASNTSFNNIPEGAIVRVNYDGSRSYRVPEKATEEQINNAKIVELVDIDTNKVYQGSILAFANALAVSDETLDVAEVDNTTDAHENAKVSIIKAVLSNEELQFLRVVKSLKMSNWDFIGVPKGKERYMYNQKSFSGYDVYSAAVEAAASLEQTERIAKLRSARVLLHNSGVRDEVTEDMCLRRPLFMIVG